MKRQYFVLCLALRKKNEWKRSGLNILGDESNLNRSFVADDIIIMMSDSDSYSQYSASESALKYCWIMDR